MQATGHRAAMPLRSAGYPLSICVGAVWRGNYRMQMAELHVLVLAGTDEPLAGMIRGVAAALIPTGWIVSYPTGCGGNGVENGTV